MDGVAVADLAEEFGVKATRIHYRAKKGGWIEKRERYCQELQKKLRLEEISAVRSARRESLQLIFGIKLLTAKTLRDRFQNGSQRVSVKDLVDLSRLELELRQPIRLEDLEAGGSPESADSIVKDQIRIALEERRAALVAAGMEPPILEADPTGMTELKAFLFGADAALPAPGDAIETTGRLIPAPSFEEDEPKARDNASPEEPTKKDVENSSTEN